MPPCKWSHVVTFGSEDPSAPAANLLKLNRFRCKDPGEDKASVTLAMGSG